MREAYFGRLVNELQPDLKDCDGPSNATCLNGRNHIVRFVESFEVGPQPFVRKPRYLENKLWLTNHNVVEDEFCRKALNHCHT